MSLFVFNENDLDNVVMMQDASLRKKDGTPGKVNRNMYQHQLNTNQDYEPKKPEPKPEPKDGKFAAYNAKINARIANRKANDSYYDDMTDYYQGITSSGETPDNEVSVVFSSAKEAASNPESADVNKVEQSIDKAVAAVKDCKDQSWLEKQKAKLEAKIKEYDNKFKKMEEENKKNGGSSIGNKLKWVFTKIKQLFLKLIKAIVSALASIQNKFRSKKESK